MNFLKESKCVERLVNEYDTHKELIVCYDFDNTIFDYHSKGYDFTETIELIRECKQMGFCLIVYTCSKEDRYSEIIKYLKENNIPFDYINKNSPKIKFAYGKLYYNILLDDRAGLKSASNQLKEAIKIIKKKGEILI